MRKSLLMVLATAGLGLPAVSIGAFAQNGGDTQQGAAMQGSPAMQAPAPGGSTTSTAAGTEVAHPPAQTPQGKRMQAEVEKRISDLQAKLKITPAQQGLWNDFAETMRANAEHADQVFQRQIPPGQQNALSAMRSYADITEAHADDVKRLLPKFQSLYEALSPEQKQAADTTFAQYQKKMMQRGAGHG